MKFHKIISFLIFLLFINFYVSAINDFVSGMARLDIGDFLIYSGLNSDREQMIASNFSLPNFVPYNREKLVNKAIGGNYHVFKTFFTVSENLADKNLTLYIGRFDMPVIIRLNNFEIYKIGFRQETDRAYATGEQAVVHLPLSEAVLFYDKENFLVIEVFPQFENNSLPELSIAEYKDNASRVFFRNLIYIHLVFAAQFLAILVAIYHFGLFISRGCKDQKYLFFSFFSFFFVLAYANIGFTYDSNYYTTLAKITRCSQLLSLGFYLLFIIESAGLFAGKKKFIETAFIVYSIACVIFIALKNSKHAVDTSFSVMINFYLIPVMVFCIVIPVLSIILRKNYKIIPLLVTTLIVAAASLGDMLLLLKDVQPLFWLAPYAFLLLVIVIYGILVNEESSLFKSFKRYVPADLVIQLINQNITADLGGKQQELTVFFSDISKFTSIVEKMEPENLIQDLCVYFESISRTILDNKGTIDKYIGDAVMAFWGAPVLMEDHAEKACHTAITVQNKLHNLFHQWDDLGKAPFLTRIGIHTGNVIVGNLGYKERLNYTVVGDTVNVSNRLEGINKVYGTKIIVSENTYKKCFDSFEFRILDRVSLLGRYQGMYIYELISVKDGVDKNQKKINEYYETGLKHYFDKNWLKALEYFNAVIKYRPNDAPSCLMQKRCILYRKNPPPAEWDGVFLQTAK